MTIKFHICDNVSFPTVKLLFKTRGDGVNFQGSFPITQPLSEMVIIKIRDRSMTKPGIELIGTSKGTFLVFNHLNRLV